MIERDDCQRIMQQLSRLPHISRLIILENVAEQVCWHGAVDREWLEKEIQAQYERKGMRV